MEGVQHATRYSPPGARRQGEQDSHYCILACTYPRRDSLLSNSRVLRYSVKVVLCARGSKISGNSTNHEIPPRGVLVQLVTG